jgi:tetraacyldisaccharide 4'-kinase
MRWRLLLWPLAVLYDVATRVRNHLYNIGYKPSFRFEIPVISVGNLNAGGSGKTPMIEYLIRLLSSNYHIATLSRGYGRTTRGIRFAGPADEASTIGDEPLQFYRKFAPSVKVVVGEERSLAIPTLLNEHPDVDLVLLDDAYQHRAIRPSFSILLSEYDRLFTHDHVLPAGDLREARKGAARADAIVITKCPEHPTDEVNVVASVKKYAGEKPVFFSTIRYGTAVSFGIQASMSRKIVALTGIAHPEPFIAHLSQQFEIARVYRFADHHRYSVNEVSNIIRYASEQGASLVTTEKDMVRLADRQLSPMISKAACFYVPIETVFLKNGAEFDELVLRSLKGPIFAS